MKSLYRFLALSMMAMILAPDSARGAGAHHVLHLFSKANYTGRNHRMEFNAADIERGVIRIEDLDATYFGIKLPIKADDLQSLYVGKGLKVTLYDKKYCQDDDNKLVLFEGDVHWIGKRWADRVGSIKIEFVDINAPVARFYEHNGSTAGNAVQTLSFGVYRTNDLIGNNIFAMMSCEKGIVVRVWDKDDDNVKAGGSTGKIISSPDFSQERAGLNLADVDMLNKISAISIEPAGYKITKATLIGEPVITPEGEMQLGGMCIMENFSSSTAESTFSMSREFANTVTRSWSNATTAGIEATLSVSSTASAGAPGVATGSTTVSASLMAKLENTFTIAGDKSETVTTTLRTDVKQNVPSGESRIAEMFMQPLKIVSNYEYTWEPTGGSGPSKTTTDKVTMIVENSVRVKVSDGPKVVVIATADKKVTVTGDKGNSPR